MNLFEMQMPILKALTIALIGICVVMMILAIIAVLIILLSKAVGLIEKIVKKKAPAEASVAAPVQSIPVPEGVNSGEVELIGTDEKTAAVIMAIVSEQSGIPLNRLSFKSIRLIDEKGGSK